jgi:outer membrane receptor protein involved in Fe transport
MSRTGRTTALALLLVPAAVRAQGGAPPGGGAPGGGPPRAPGAGGPAGAAMPQAAGQLTGRVLGAAGQGVANASVTVRGAEGRDTALVGGALTRADGAFRVEGLRPGRYTVRVRALGFAPLVRRDVAVTAADPRVDLGRLTLSAVAAQLTSVEVQADRSTESLAPDRNTFTVKDMPATAGGTAVDVLRNVPAVEVDGDNNVSLRGNSNVVVQINGRVSPMRGQALGNFLAQLPANMVAKVEVVSNPSAKNDPEGLGGIVNIVLKQQADLGTSGGFSGGGGSTGQVNANGNLGHQSGPWTLFSSYGFMHDRRTVSGFSSRSAMVGVGAVPGSGLNADLDGVMRPESHSFTGTAEYKAGAKDVLANNLVVNRRAMSRDFGSFYRAVDGAGTLTGRTDQRTDQSQGGTTLDYALTWRHTPDQQKNTLVTEVRANLGRDENDLAFSNASLRPDGSPSGVPTALETNLTTERARAFFAQTDWTRELRKGTKLETGYKGIFRRQTSDFDVATAAGTGPYAPDLFRSNAYTFYEHVNAVYGVLSQRAGRVDLQAGLRLETADTRFNLATTGRRYDNDYKSAFPSALASFTDARGRNFKASYSKRISRPDVRQLNPFGFREDQFTAFEGNPSLRPEYTHAYELGFQQPLGKGQRGGPNGGGGTSGTLQITPFLRHTVSSVRQVGRVDEAGILRLTFANAASVDQYGADMNLSVRRGRFNGFGGGSVFEQVTDASNLGALGVGSRVRAFGWSARANGTLKLTPTLDLQGFTMYRAPMRVEQGRISRFALANIALRQKLRGDQASVTVRVMDPFGTMGWAVRANDGRVLQTMDRRFGARGTFLNFSYNFGKAPRIRARPQEQDQAPQAGGVPGPG